MNLLSRNSNGEGSRVLITVVGGLVLKKIIMVREIQELVDGKFIGGDNIVGIKTEFGA